MLIALCAPKLLSMAFWRLIKIDKVGIIGILVEARGGKKGSSLEGGEKKRDLNS